MVALCGVRAHFGPRDALIEVTGVVSLLQNPVVISRFVTCLRAGVRLSLDQRHRHCRMPPRMLVRGWPRTRSLVRVRGWSLCNVGPRCKGTRTRSRHSSCKCRGAAIPCAAAGVHSWVHNHARERRGVGEHGRSSQEAASMQGRED